MSSTAFHRVPPGLACTSFPPHDHLHAASAAGAAQDVFDEGPAQERRPVHARLAPGLREVVFPRRLDHWYPPDGRAPDPGPPRGVNVSGEARPSIWLARRVVGRREERDGVVVWQLHVDVGAEGRAAVAEELGRVERFLASSGLTARAGRSG